MLSYCLSSDKDESKQHSARFKLGSHIIKDVCGSGTLTSNTKRAKNVSEHVSNTCGLQGRKGLGIIKTRLYFFPGFQ